MTTTQETTRTSRSPLPWIVGGAVVVVAVGGFALTRTLGSAMAADSQPTTQVRQGPLTISVVQPGTIKSLESIALKSEVEGQTTLIYLIPEGTPVEEGDLLVELDASRLQDELIQQQITLDSATAAFIRARENLAVVKNQAASNISKAQLDLRFAEGDVKQYLEGQYPQDLNEATVNITLAEEDLKRAADKLEWTERLLAEKYISQMERDADALTHNRARLNYELAVARRQLLVDYTHPRKVDELKSNVEQARMALERIQLQANADIVQAEADLKARTTELEQQQAKLAKTERQIARTKIYAPRAGLVVYATSVQRGGGRMRTEPLQEGQSVRERQELIYLPSADSMMAEVQIHESSLQKVSVGQRVRLTVDALPGRTFAGRVAKIAPLPDAQAAWLNPDLKVYPTEIHLTGTHPELRTGMSCQAEIIVEQHADAMYVPIQAVVRLGNAPHVYVRADRGFRPQPVRIGLDNNSMIHVLAGLQPGQEVLLAPPLGTHADDREAHEETAAADAPDAGPPRGGEGSPGAAGPPGARGNERMGRAPEQGMSDMTPEQRKEARRRFQNMTPEEREEMRRRMENMTPEEREAFERRRSERTGGDRPAGDGPRGDGARGEGPRGGGGSP